MVKFKIYIAQYKQKKENIQNDSFRILSVDFEKVVCTTIDLLAKNIAPNSTLRKAFHNGELEYKKFLKLIKSKKLITLLSASKTMEHSHVEF